MRWVWNVFQDVGGDLLDGLYEQIWLDPGIIDLVVWFPNLSWSQFLYATAAVLSWSWISEQLRRLASRWLRRMASRWLFRLALFVAPSGRQQAIASTRTAPSIRLPQALRVLTPVTQQQIPV